MADTTSSPVGQLPKAESEPAGPNQSPRHPPQEAVLKGFPPPGVGPRPRRAGAEHEKPAASTDDAPVRGSIGASLEAQVHRGSPNPQPPKGQLRQPRRQPGS